VSKIYLEFAGSACQSTVTSFVLVLFQVCLNTNLSFLKDKNTFSNRARFIFQAP